MPGKRQIIVDYDTEDSSYRSYARDISVDGVFIETGEPFAVGQEILLTFVVDCDYISFMVTGKIANKVPNGIEVKFEKLTQKEREQLSFFHLTN